MGDRAMAELSRTQAFILAGGQGERLRPLTISRPKPAVSFGDAFRIIDFTLSNCFHSQVSRASFLTQCGHEEMNQYVRKGWSGLWSDGTFERRPLNLLPPANGKTYRGTADAVFQNRHLLQDDDVAYVLILSGDHVYHMDYRDLLHQHVATDADLTIATVEHSLREAYQFGVVEVDQSLRVTGFEEKPANPRSLPMRPSVAMVSMGVYIFKKTVLLKSLQEYCGSDLGHDFGRNIIPSLIHSARTFAYEFRDKVRDCPRYWRDIGTLDGFYQASTDLVRPDSPFDPYASDICPSQPTRHPGSGRRSMSAANSWMDSGSGLSGTVASRDVQLGEGVLVTDSILMPGVRIGKGVQLHRTIVEEGVHIPSGYRAGYDSVRDRREHVVTNSGVVVISRTPFSRPAVQQVAQRRPVHHVTEQVLSAI
jgi:glucose-1-phosphate adenylyltransferase